MKIRITNTNRDYYALLPLLKRQLVLIAEKTKTYKTLIRPVATFRTESWTWNKDIDKRLAAFDGRVFRRMLEELK
jgi:hypothetical protein